MSGEPTSQTNPTPGRTTDLYAQITQKVLDMLNKGIVPWRSPILGQSAMGVPKNLESHKPYRGVNVFLLAITAYFKGYESAYWLTFNQARALGGTVKKGEKSTPVVFWKMYETKDSKTGDIKNIPILRSYNVFNVQQCQDVPVPDAVSFTPTEFYPVERADLIVKGFAGGPKIEHQGAQACYRPRPDAVQIPEPFRFTSAEEYYSTLFHELSHSTGHSSRLNRHLDEHLMPFGSPDYGKEELIAEMSAAFLCGQAGIHPAVITNQAAYISGWLGKLRQDKKLLILAASAAQRSADWILGNRQHNPEDSQTPTNPPAPQSPPRNQTLVDAAQAYLAQGYAPIPIPAGQKGPVLKNWQHLRLKPEEIPQAFHDAGNLGLLLGPASGDLVDVDLDCPEARDLADRFLPPTPAITGRPSSPRSHRWYIAPNLQTHRHRDPLTHASILEVRGEGSQTLVGPSIHPTGEPYDFLNGTPATINAEELHQAAQTLANEIIRLRHGDLIPEKPAARLPAPTPTPTDDRTHLLKRASAYLGSMPPAIAGHGGHNATYAAATALIHGFGLTESEALPLLLTQYNPRCDPPWTVNELEHKLVDAATKPHEKVRGWLARITII